MLRSAVGSSSHNPKTETFEMRLTDWLMVLRDRHAWPPGTTPIRFPNHATFLGRPSSESHKAGVDSRRNAGWRYRIPTRRLPGNVYRELTPRPVS